MHLACLLAPLTILTITTAPLSETDDDKAKKALLEPKVVFRGLPGGDSVSVFGWSRDGKVAYVVSGRLGEIGDFDYLCILESNTGVRHDCVLAEVVENGPITESSKRFELRRAWLPRILTHEIELGVYGRTETKTNDKGKLVSATVRSPFASQHRVVVTRVKTGYHDHHRCHGVPDARKPPYPNDSNGLPRTRKGPPHPGMSLRQLQLRVNSAFLRVAAPRATDSRVIR